MKTVYLAFKIGCIGFTDSTKNIMQGKWKTEWRNLTSREFLQRRVSSILAK